MAPYRMFYETLNGWPHTECFSIRYMVGSIQNVSQNINGWPHTECFSTHTKWIAPYRMSKHAKWMAPYRMFFHTY